MKIKNKIKGFLTATIEFYRFSPAYINASGILCALTINSNIVRSLCVWFVLVHIFSKKDSSFHTNNTYTLSQPMQVEHMNFTSEKVMIDSINRQLDRDYKVNIIIGMIEDWVVNDWEDDEINTLSSIYTKASDNCWRERKVNTYKANNEITTKIETKTEEEYQEAINRKDIARDNLKKYLKNAI